MVAALVKTLVVSWNDAAEIKLSVSNDALVIRVKLVHLQQALPPLSKISSFESMKANRST